MPNESIQMGQQEGREFERHAREAQPGIVSEFVHFLSHSKKWWLTPIVVVLFLLGIVLVAGGTGAAPFIYTLF